MISVLRAVRIPLLFAIGAAFLPACDNADGLSRLIPEGEYNPELLEFGEVPLGLERILTTEFTNVGQIAFTIDEIVVPRDAGFVLKEPLDASDNGGWVTDPAQLGQRAPLAPGASYVFEIGYSPTAEGFKNAELVVRAQDQEFALGLTGTGVIRQVPLLTARPNPVNFGRVPVNTPGSATLELINSGNGPAVVTQANFNDSNSPYSLRTPLPVTVEAGGRAMLDLEFVPTQDGSVTDTITFVVTDHDLIGVGLFGEGLLPLGDVTCTPTVLDFGPVERGTQAMRQVTCTAGGGSSRIVSASVNSPEGGFTAGNTGTADLNSGESVTLDVTFTAAGLPRREDGSYNVQYSGSNGVDTTQIQLTAEVVPPPPTETAISVRMTWDRNDTDVDLHLVGPGGSLFDGDLDCHYLNENPDWGRQGDTTDNPFLDDDDTDGLGPENINLTEAASGRYEIYAHYYSDHRNGATTVTTEVFLGGRSMSVSNRNLNCNAVWHVGSVNWSGTNGTFAPSNAMSMSNEGSCN